MKLIAALRLGFARPKLPSRENGAFRRRLPLYVATTRLTAIAVLMGSPSFAQSPPAPSATETPAGKRLPARSDTIQTPPAAPTIPASASTTATPASPGAVPPSPDAVPSAPAPPPTAGAPASGSVPPIAPAPPDAKAPPPYPSAPPVEAPPDAGSNDDAIYEPPLPEPRGTSNGDDGAMDDAPLPPPPTKHVAPRSSFWVGARPGVFVPLGAMWLDGEPVVDLCCTESVRPFSEFAGPGPSLGFDIGVRFARHYQAFAFGEHAWLSSGSLEDDFGGQTSASTSMFGGGFRFSTHPDTIGLLVEISLGYRTFEAEWESGTRLTAGDDLFSTRLGFGVEWRINPLTTLELLLIVGGGAFTDVEWTFADGTKRSALTGYDRYGQYIPFSLQLASHWDVISSDD